MDDYKSEIEETSDVEEVVAVDEPTTAKATKPAAKKRPARKPSSATGARSRSAKAGKPPSEPRKRRVKADEPVVPVLTMKEAGEKLNEAKEEFKGAIAAPVVRAWGKYSEMARDGLSGAVAGFLGNKRKE